MKDSGYLTIEEAAKKLGRPASWVKDRICEGGLGAILAGRQWLISEQDADKLLLGDPPPAEPRRVVHNFLPDRRTKQPRSAPDVVETPAPTRRAATTGRSRSSFPQARDARLAKDDDKKRILTQQIKDLDRKFDQLSSRLRKAMLEYRPGMEPGMKAAPPSNLLQKWKATKGELRYLVAKADSEGLILPANLSIYEVLAQEAELIAKQKAGEGNGALTRTSAPIKGIDGYGGGPGYGGSKEVRRVPAGVEARLIIARSKERAAARSMQDRGKSKAARDAASADWARFRLQAEDLGRSAQTPQGASPQVSPSPPGVSPAFGARPASKKVGTTKNRLDRAAPLGDPDSGVVLLVEQPAGLRVREALKRSLRVVGLPTAYVVYASTGLLEEKLRSSEPRALVAVGPGAARDIDAGGYRLVCQPFSEAEPGAWFTWTTGTMGLLLPSLTLALDDEVAKRNFWRGFLNLKALAPTQ